MKAIALTPAQEALFLTLRVETLAAMKKLRKKRVELLMNVREILADEAIRKTRQLSALVVVDKPEELLSDLNLSSSSLEEPESDDFSLPDSPDLLRPDVNEENVEECLRESLEQLKENLEQHWKVWERFVRDDVSLFHANNNVSCFP